MLRRVRGGRAEDNWPACVQQWATTVLSAIGNARYGAKSLAKGCATLIPWERSMSIEDRGEITSKASRAWPERRFLGLLRRATLIAVLARAAGSLGLMFYAGRRQNSRILLLLFAIWVLSPFIALLWANVVSKCWSILTRATLYSVMLVLTLGSLAIYGDVALGPPRPKPAFVFLVVPLASSLLIAIVIPAGVRLSQRLSRRRDRA